MKEAEKTLEEWRRVIRTEQDDATGKWVAYFRPIGRLRSDARLIRVEDHETESAAVWELVEWAYAAMYANGVREAVELASSPEPPKSITRDRALTEAEAERYDEVRAQVEQEFPPLSGAPDKPECVLSPDCPCPECQDAVKRALSKSDTEACTIIRLHIIRRADLRRHPHWIFLFGDNLEQRGRAGQAKEMRGEPNAIGIPTKKAPGMSAQDFFTDEEYEQNCAAIRAAFARIPKRATVVIPVAGLGTGLAELPERAPRTFEFLERCLSELRK